MKKILLLLISLISFMLFTNNVYAYDDIDYGDYKIRIEGLTLEYYDEEGYFAEVDSMIDLYYDSYHTVDLSTEKTISPEGNEDTWYMNGDFPVTLIDLNVDISDFEQLIRDNLPSGRDELMVGIFVEYKYLEVPTGIQSTYPINYIEVMYNSLLGAWGSHEYHIYRLGSSDTVKVPLVLGTYQDGEIEVFDSLTELAEEDSVSMLLNYDIQSTTDSETYQDTTGGELVYIHTMDDVDVIKTSFEEMYKPRIYVSYYTDSEIELGIYTNDDNATTCELYRSTSRAGGYRLIDTNNCDASFTDNDVEPDRTYYYKVEDNNGKVSEITTVSTDPEYEDPVDDDRPSYDDWFDDDEEETPTEPTTTQKKDSGTVDNKDTGIHSFIIIGVAAIVVAVIILKYNKNSMKTKL